MPRVDARFPTLRQLHERQNLAALRAEFRAQLDDGVALRQRLIETWDVRMADLMFDRNMAAATEAGGLVADRMSREFNPGLMVNWLTRNAEIGAERINNATRARITELGAAEAFEELLSSQAEMYAVSMAGMSINFGAKEGALQSGSGMKTWQTNSGNPRSSHAAMGGETVPIGEKFSNGMDWPGDPEGGAEEVANCECSLVFL